VTHDRYGLGRVLSIEDGTSVVIDFRTHRVRILTPYARLTKL
ncbi:MAG: uvrD1 2, partial [Actinomycetia bacterium]|nr:uvrD1 2 [Actinomycetes bacterium]